MNSPLPSLAPLNDSATPLEFAARLWARLALGLWIGWAALFLYAATVALRAL